MMKSSLKIQMLILLISCLIGWLFDVKLNIESRYIYWVIGTLGGLLSTMVALFIQNKIFIYNK